jgi:hypothetical protein
MIQMKRTDVSLLKLGAILFDLETTSLKRSERKGCFPTQVKHNRLIDIGSMRSNIRLVAVILLSFRLADKLHLTLTIYFDIGLQMKCKQDH